MARVMVVRISEGVRRQFAQEICRELEKRGFADVTVTAEGRQEAK